MDRHQQLGKILWWSERDKNGIIVDTVGNEFYFDSSVVLLRKRQQLNNGSLVLFSPSRCDQVLVAKDVTIPLSKVRSRYERKYEKEKDQLSLPISA